MHSGHRDRLRNKVLKYGFGALEKHELLELYLTYSIPRRNTNDIAHNLLNEFNSIKNLFSADIDDLLKVDGVGLNSALLIKLLNPLYRIYSEDRLKVSNKPVMREKIYDYINKNYSNKDKDKIFLLKLSDSDNFMTFDKINIAAEGCFQNLIRDIIKKAVRDSTKYVILAYHASKNYVKLVKEMNYYFSLMDINMIDCVLVSNESCDSIMDKVIE